MPKKSKNHYTHHFTPNGFGGIDLKNPKQNASEVYNFRIMPDGSIMKRQGFKRLATLSEAPTYFGIFNINSSEVGLAVIGKKIFEVDLESGECSQYMGTLDAKATNCDIVFYNENILIFDGTHAKLVKDGEVQDFNGYVPLYGKAWHPTGGGPVHEQLNIVSERYRVNYSLSSDTDKIRLPNNADYIDYVEVNGEALYSDDYSFDRSTKFVHSEKFSSDGGSVTFWISFENEEISTLHSCTKALAVSSGSSPVIFCYGRSGRDGIFCLRSVPVSEEERRNMHYVYSDEFDLYIPYGGSFTVGSGENTIRAVIPYDERVIVFTDHDAWFVPIISNSVMPETLNKSIGCSSPYGVAYCGESPVTVCHNRLFIWTPTLDPYNPLNAVSVSNSVELQEAEADKFIKVFVNRYGSELWIFNESSETDNILIYDYEAEKWFSFGDFYPSFIFNYGGQVGFVEGSGIFLFDDDAVYDERIDGIPQYISAVYTSAWAKIDDTGKIKHADRLITEAYSGRGGRISITLVYNYGSTDDALYTVTEASLSPQIFVKRLPHSRFREVRFTITADGASSERIYDVALELTVDDGNQC